MPTHALTEKAVVLRPEDDVAIVKTELIAGVVLEDGAASIAVGQDICSASVSQCVKDKFRDVQKAYPDIDGVLAITHKSGCGTKLFGEDHQALHRVLAG